MPEPSLTLCALPSIKKQFILINDDTQFNCENVYVVIKLYYFQSFSDLESCIFSGLSESLTDPNIYY